MPQNTRRYFEESENLLRGRTPESYGAEFAPIMRSKIGERFRDIVTPEKLGLVSLVGHPRMDYNLAGANFFENPDKVKLEEAVQDTLGHVVEPGQSIQGKRIFGIGRGADAATYAHELRHEKVGMEYMNRAHDLIYGSTSLPAYKANVNKIFSYLTGFKSKERNRPLEQKERMVLDWLKENIRSESFEADKENANFWTALLNANFVNKNMELNKSGAVGGYSSGDPNSKKLPDSVVRYRAKMPFLNFVGRLGESTPVKKAAGGDVENTTHYRKIL